MYKTVLVDIDIGEGRKVLAELEKDISPISAAFWYHFDEEDDWKLMVVSPEVSDIGPRQLYQKVSEVLQRLQIEPQRLQYRIRLESPYSLLYKMVKQHAGPVGGPIREGPVLDAYIYKMQ